jgi:membrane carboxypeptidase/penicillin-binding protein PbpC
MERPKRQSAIEKDYRERKRQKKGDNNEKVQKFVALFQFLFIFPIKKKSATPPIITTTIREDPQSLFEQLYKDVVNYRDPEE